MEGFWNIRGLVCAIRYIVTISLYAKIVDRMRVLIGKISHFDQSTWNLWRKAKSTQQRMKSVYSYCDLLCKLYVSIGKNIWTKKPPEMQNTFHMYVFEIYLCSQSELHGRLLSYMSHRVRALCQHIQNLGHVIQNFTWVSPWNKYVRIMSIIILIATNPCCASHMPLLSSTY